MKSGKQVIEDVEAKLKNDELRKKLEALPQIWERTKFDVGYFDKQRLKMNLLLLEEDVKGVLFRAATDWGILETKPLVKDESMSTEEFANQVKSYQLSWTNKGPDEPFVVEDPKECLQNLIFVMLALAGETNCDTEQIKRICVISIGRLEMLLYAMYLRIRYLEQEKVVDSICETNTLE